MELASAVAAVAGLQLRGLSLPVRCLGVPGRLATVDLGRARISFPVGFLDRLALALARVLFPLARVFFSLAREKLA